MPKLGVMTMTHGVPAGPQALQHPSNVALVQHLKDLDLPFPHVHGFMQIPGKIQPAIDELTSQGVDLVVGIFLYPWSTNNEIANTYAELGFGPRPEGYEFPYTPVTTNAEVILSRPLKPHPLIVDVLQDRLLEVAQNPKDEVALVWIHGEMNWPSIRYHHYLWIEAMVRMLKKRAVFKDVDWATHYPTDNTAEISRALVERNGGARLIATHVMTEDSYFNNEHFPHGVAEGLGEGGNYAVNQKPMLPHPAWGDYIMGMLAETLRDHDMAHLIPDAVRGRLREMGNTARAIT
jgi:hypothetical protein